MREKIEAEMNVAEENVEFYSNLVWYQGKVWVNEHLTDAQGHLSLMSIRDTSFGTQADASETRTVTDEATRGAVRRILK
jgi:hypothetical protein